MAAAGALIDGFRDLIKQADATTASGADRDAALSTTQPGDCEGGFTTRDDNNDARGSRERSEDGTGDIGQFERYLRIHLPQAVSERLGDSHVATNDMPEAERERMVRIVQDAQNEVMRSFHSHFRLDSGLERVHGPREDER
ncbi:hypothetical protein QIS74_02813 [Colletotrichum tabaci]|uniref:Uncharacterized protein n=1 Tax=Colletotrichum tabaci TaxID=1209068 RepID=A0AAV9TPE0_9PEZI